MYKKICAISLSTILFISGTILWIKAGDVSIRSHLETTQETILEHSVSSTVVVKYADPVKKEGGMGSGVVISSDGYILTVYHNLMKGEVKNYTINLYDDPLDYKFEIIAISKDQDLALLKLKKLPKNGIHYIEMAKSDTVRVGSTVYIIGNPFGMTWTISKGIVSMAHRMMQDGDYIQTDASMTFGNSGGPIINENGEIVGIVRMMVIAPNSSLGLGITIERCEKFLNNISK